MTRKMTFLFCENEHGTGDVCFPEVSGTEEDVKQKIVKSIGTTVRMLRADAKKAGWGRVNGGDYCPGCMECM